MCAVCGTLSLDHDGFTVFGLPAVSLLFYADAAFLAAACRAGSSREP